MNKKHPNLIGRKIIISTISQGSRSVITKILQQNDFLTKEIDEFSDLDNLKKNEVGCESEMQNLKNKDGYKTRRNFDHVRYLILRIWIIHFWNLWKNWWSLDSSSRCCIVILQ